MHTFVSTQMDYVIFVYGLAFFLLGAACLSMRARAFLQLPWGWLAAFAFSHGSAEWLDLAALGFGRNQTLSAIKIVLIIASFVFLFQFALAGLAQRAHTAGSWAMQCSVLHFLWSLLPLPRVD